MNRLVLFIVCLSTLKAEAQTSALAIADSLYSVGNYAKAILVYEKIDQAKPKVYQKMAQAYQARGNFDKALYYYRQATEDKTLIVATVNYGKLLLATQNHQKADSIFTKLIERFPKNPDFYYQLGLVKEKQKDSTAINQFFSVLQYDAYHQKALYKIARFYFQKKNYKQTDSLGTIALQAYPKNVSIKSLLAQNAFATRDYLLAIRYFTEVLQLEHTSEFIFEKLGLAHYHLGHYSKAIKSFQEVIRINQDNAKVHLYLGKLYNLSENYNEAEKHLLYALLLTKIPLDEHYQTLGLTYKMKKDYKKAIRYFKLALKENPNRMRAQYELALTIDKYYADKKMCVKHYQLFIEQHKKNPKASSYIDFAQYRIQELRQELHMAAKKE